ncbi:MAG: ABC transporter permease [Planctomycetota bacterium]|jgi:lipoprotein-releasing system permease protein
MYHALLTNRYLTSRVIPLIAVAAVALCVALVIIVVSVMTGFLDMVRSSGRTLMGDVIVSYSVKGIPYYERLIERIERLPEAAAATPVVDSWGLLKMPYPEGPNKETETVQVWGIEPDSFARVTGYGDTLYWRPQTPQELAEMREDDPRRFLNERRPGEDVTSAELLLADGLALRDSRSGLPGIVLGLHVSQGNERQSDGSIRPMGAGHWWMPLHDVTLTMLPTKGGGVVEPESEIFPVVNEFFSGVFLIDDKRVMIPLAIAQRRLHLDAEDILADEGVDPATGLPGLIGVDPPRATLVLVRAADGVTPKQLLEPVHQAYDEFRNEILADDTALVKAPPRELGLTIKTWEQQQAQFIDPIEKERELMRTLFSLVYLVCAGLVLSIFWAIVYEKTRDIGILRSIGASRLGISWIFLRYGLVVGIAGAIVGLGLAWLIVRNINTIHRALGDPPVLLAFTTGAVALIALAVTVLRGRSGRLLPIVLGTLITVTLAAITALIMWVQQAGGIVIWDPSVYYFTEIPNEMDMVSAAITMVGAVVFSLIGAFLPAAKAADTDPVRALRYE